MFEDESDKYEVRGYGNGQYGDGSQFPTEAYPEEEIEENNVQQVVCQVGKTETDAIFRRGLLLESEMGREVIVDEETQYVADGVGYIHIHPVHQYPVDAIVDGSRCGSNNTETDDLMDCFLIDHKTSFLLQKYKKKCTIHYLLGIILYLCTQKQELMQNKMIGVILAAGMAKRLRPLTDTKPKCLLEVGGKTLLQRTVDAMVSAGISDFLVVTGYRAPMIRDFLDNLYTLGYPRIPRIAYIDNPDYEHNNNIFSLWLAMQQLHGQEVLLMDSDILCDPEAVRRVARQDRSALAMQRHELGEEEMKIVVDAGGSITEISKTCRVEDAIGESVGIEKMTSAYSEALYQELRQMIQEEGLIDIFYERAFERLIPQGHTFKVVDTTDLFSYELDTPEDFQKATESIPQELI